MSIEDVKKAILEGMKEDIRNTVKDSIDRVVESKSKKKGYMKDEDEYDDEEEMEEQDNHDDDEDHDDEEHDDEEHQEEAACSGKKKRKY